MKRFFLSLALIAGIGTLQAQVDTTATAIPNIGSPSTGDFYLGLTRPLTFNRMIPPYALEVTFSKTVCAHKGE